MHQWGSQKYGKFKQCREQISSELLNLNSIHVPNVETIDQINIKEKESDEILNLKEKYWSQRVKVR